MTVAGGASLGTPILALGTPETGRAANFLTLSTISTRRALADTGYRVAVTRGTLTFTLAIDAPCTL